jgi:transcriptional regulator of arginine metabolism
MTKQARHFAIKELIAAGAISSQDGLRRGLKKRGCAVTQATLSRDMKELGIVRAPGAGGWRYAMQAEGEVRALRPLVNAEVLGIDANESMIVIHTLPGCANTVGEFIDVQKHPDVIGTVAGDNTLLIIPRSLSRTQPVMRFLKNKLIEGQE